MKNKNRVCPVALAGSLDSTFRRWLHNPRKILKPHISEGMHVLDIGCGPGFFSIEMAGLTGKTGRVTAADMQEGMLEIVKKKIQNTELADRIILHKCSADKIGIASQVDFALAFYMVHEVPDKKMFFQELSTIIKPGGSVYIVEPAFHVSVKSFYEMIAIAESEGFRRAARPKLFIDKAVLLKR